MKVSERRGARWWALCLAALGTGACSGLLHGVARTVADEAGGESGPPGTAAAPRSAASPATSTAGRAGPGDPTPETPPPATTSTYESTPLLGLSAPTYARPYSLMGSLFDAPDVTPACRIGARGTGDVLYPPEGTPVEASGPLGLRVTHSGAPLFQAFDLDPQLRSARAFHSGAVLSGEGRVCGRSFAHYYLELSLGWSPMEPVAVAR